MSHTLPDSVSGPRSDSSVPFNCRTAACKPETSCLSLQDLDKFPILFPGFVLPVARTQISVGPQEVQLPVFHGSWWHRTAQYHVTCLRKIMTVPLCYATLRPQLLVLQDPTLLMPTQHSLKSIPLYLAALRQWLLGLHPLESRVLTPRNMGKSLNTLYHSEAVAAHVQSSAHSIAYRGA